MELSWTGEAEERLVFSVKSGYTASKYQVIRV